MNIAWWHRFPAPTTQIPLRLSQAELASWIGSCRETVDRTFARWRSRGIISTRYRTIIVHDLETLARIAGIQVSRRAWSLTRGPRARTIA
jgi:Crp-like helix-turn-helix domain